MTVVNVAFFVFGSLLVLLPCYLLFSAVRNM